MKVGSPFKCTHCGASLTWTEEAVIECEYCHTKILMKNIAMPDGARPKINVAFLIIGAAVVAGVVIIAAKASDSKTAKLAPANAAAPPTTPTTPPPVKLDKAAEPASIAKVLLKFGEAGTNAGQFTDARAIAVVPNGDIVVAEARTGRVQVFDDKGAYQRLITLPPSALTKELTVFGAGATPDGKVIVSRAGDLLVLDVKAGTVERTIRGSYPEVFYRGDVDVAPDGSIWATTNRTGDLGAMHLSATGKVLGKVAKWGSNHVAVDGIGTMYLTKQFGDASVEVRDSKGEVQRKFSQAGTSKLASPGAVAIDGKGHLFIVENNRVIVFDPEGAFLGELTVPGAWDLAVDRSGALYVLRRDGVTKFELTLPAKK